MQKLRVADPCVASWEEMAPSPLGRRCERCEKDVHDLRFVTEARARAVVLLFGGDEPPCVRLRVDVEGDAVFRSERTRSVRRREPVIVAAALASLSTGCGASTPAETVAAPAVCAPVARVREEAPARVPTHASDARSAEPAPDTDGDGLVDPLDACPGDAAGVDGADGCPPVRRVIVVENGGASAMQPVRFAMNASALTPDATRMLDEVAKILTEHPEVTRVNVVGHAAPDEMNAERIARRRAADAVKYLVGHGVDPSRLVASGAGATRPIGDNATTEGRAQNRRLELAIQPP
jgi:outer membrane protein OmpA-like peptidoglycan-associated protein